MNTAAERNKDRWNQVSIRQKIQYSVSLFSLMVLLVSTLTFVWFGNRQFHQNTQRELTILASVLAGNSQAAVTFNDKPGVTSILSAIEKNPNILSAVIEKNGEIFAAYPQNQAEIVNNTSGKDVWQAGEYYYAEQPIMVNNRPVGTLTIKSNLDGWNQFWKRLLMIFAALLATIALLAYVLSYWLKKHVTLPLRALSDWATEVYTSKSFHARAEKRNDDEIGQLADNLNNMLSELSKQESILSLNKSLEEEISVRKQTEDELINMRDKAEQANQSKSAFLANMSHEIRTPMNAIIGFVDLVMEGDLNDEQHKHLMTVRQSARDLHNLLNEILDVAKMEEGKLELEKLPFSVRNVIDHVVKTFELKARNKNIQLIQRVSKKLPEYFLGDSLRLNQILINLVGNAIKFTESGSITVAVDQLPSGDLRFLVRDTGIGIPEDKLEHIFESFSQADSSTNRKYGGTGLGTTISKQLIELMGGRIWVESEEGVGSTFYFTVKLEETDNKEELEELDNNPALLKTIIPLNILIAEDMFQNAELLRIRLEALGHHITHVTNGIDAISSFGSDDFDIILMDIQMPEMDGLKATEKIRKLPYGKDIPILALTASVMHEDRVACEEAGMDGFVKKPIVFNELYSEMSRVLQDKFRVPDNGDNIKINVQDINQTPLINFQQGIETWGSTEAFTKNLKQFSQLHRDDSELLTSLVRNKKEDEIHQLIHALRGTAGNLALDQLYLELQKIHEEMKAHGMLGITSEIHDLGMIFQSTIAAINKLKQNQNHLPSPRKTNDSNDILRKASQLRELLERGELNEILVEELSVDLPLLDISEEMITEMIRHIDDFEFESATKALEKILARISAKGARDETEQIDTKNSGSG